MTKLIQITKSFATFWLFGAAFIVVLNAAFFPDLTNIMFAGAVLFCTSNLIGKMWG
jgi:hypothetical protein